MRKLICKLFDNEGKGYVTIGDFIINSLVAIMFGILIFMGGVLVNIMFLIGAALVHIIGLRDINIIYKSSLFNIYIMDLTGYLIAIPAMIIIIVIFYTIYRIAAPILIWISNIGVVYCKRSK